MARSVRRPYERINKQVVNQSSRHGAAPVRIVLHSTESANRPGTGDLDAVWGWFNNPSAQASSHVIVDNEGYSAQCVADESKAWAQADYNSDSLSIEFIGAAAQNKAAWLLHNRAQILKGAKYIAYWSKKYNLPIQRSVANGVCTHKDLGQRGGGHVDPGANFPMAALLAAAKWYKRYGWKP